MKRFITLLLAVLMICALTVPAFAAPRRMVASTLSEGNIIIIVIIALVAVLAVIYLVVRSKKNKK